MIYLIDDKKSRQKDFGWSAINFEKYSNILRLIYTSEEALAARDEIFSDQSKVILFHESFFDNPDSNRRKESLNIKVKIENYTKDYSHTNLVVFSGSKSSKKIIDNIAHLPVSVFYQNLKVFIEYYSKGNLNLQYLFFGENFRIEEKLNIQLEIYHSLFSKSELNSETLFEKVKRYNEISGKSIKIYQGMEATLLKSQING